jgi:L-alanine-DL-glutamate epimerase-like enolase superfamily enzyme
MRAATGQLALGVDGVSFEEANERLRAAVRIRVDAHRRRERGAMTVHEYLTALRWVRAVEDELEPIRELDGYCCSRAFELCTAHTADHYKTPDRVLHPTGYGRGR